MQLLGAPKLNDFQAPYCAFQTPMEAAFQRDDEIETYVKTRNGTLSRVGDQALRGRFRLGWDGLDYDTAARILFELKSGEVVLTPRTDIGGGGVIDLDGDGIPDLILEEVALPCRVVSEIPTSTPVGRFSRGDNTASLEIELETLDTYDEVPGFAVPAIVKIRTFDELGESYRLNTRLGTSSCLVEYGSGSFVEQTGSFYHIFPAGVGEQETTFVFTSKVLDDFILGLSPASGGGNRKDEARILVQDSASGFASDFSDVEVDGDVSLGGAIGNRVKPQAIGEVTAANQFKRVTGTYSYNFTQQFASAIPRDISSLVATKGGTLIEGDAMDLPTNLKSMNRVRVTGDSLIKAGGPVGPNTEEYRGGNNGCEIDPVTFGKDNVGGAQTDIRNLRVLGFGRTGQPTPGWDRILKAGRKLEAVSANEYTLNGEDFRGPGVIPPNMRTFSFRRRSFNSYVPTDYSFCSSLETFNIGSNGSLHNTNDPNNATQLPTLWNGFYGARTLFPTDTSGNPKTRLFLARNGTLGNLRVALCAATNPDQLWKMVGMRSYFGDGVVDHVQELRLVNMVNLTVDVAASTSSTLVASYPLDANPDPENRGSIFRAQGGDAEVYVQDGNGTNGRRWMEMFVVDSVEGWQNNTIRLQGTDTSDNPVDTELTISSYTHDGSTLTLNVSGTVPSLSNATMLYAFYFETPAP